MQDKEAQRVIDGLVSLGPLGMWHFVRGLNEMKQ